MLAKITTKNQLTLPKSITAMIERSTGPIEYFDVQATAGQIILTPVRIQRSDALRTKLAELDINANDVDSAVTWSRRKP